MGLIYRKGEEWKTMVMEEENKYLILGDSESRNLATIIF